MPNVLEKIMVGKDVFSEKLDNLTVAVLGLSATQGGDFEITNWKQIQAIVRMGLAPKFFSVGDIIYVNKEKAISINSSNGSLSVSINAETFIEAIGEQAYKDYETHYDGVEWLNEHDEPIVLAFYGITINSGTPQVGDKIVVHETIDRIPFVVVDFDKETPVDSTRTHSMSLVMLNTFTGVQFCATQALFVFPSGLPIGSYKFSIASNYESSYGGGSTLYFTLTVAIPAGGQIVFPWAGSTQASATKITTYSGPTSTVALESNISVSTTEIVGAIDLGTIANGPIQEVTTVTDAPVKINNAHRARYGSNNWEESAIRQWCNSDKPKGSVWTSKNIFDRPPSWASTLDGFMHGLDVELKEVIGEVKKGTKLNTITDGGGKVITNEKCWLISMGELGVTGYSSDEGSQYKYWEILMNGTAIADWSTHAELIKTNAGGTAQYWWMRSPSTGISHYARLVNPSGYVTNSHAHIGLQAVVGFAII